MDPLELLRRLLQTDTTNPPGNEAPAAELLRSYLEPAGISTDLYRSSAGRVSLLARIPGPSDVPALVLVSHTDVVGVERERWTQDPFGAVETGGSIWARGALDMKGVAVMHAEALVRLATSGRPPRREVIFVSVADEETGGSQGMKALLEEHPNRLGFTEGRAPPEALGEGAFGLTGILDRAIMPIVLGEKTALWIDLKATGDPGHGSLPPRRQANVNLARAVTDVEGYRSPRVHPVMREQFRTLAAAISGPRSKVFGALASPAGAVVARALGKPLRRSGAIGALLADTLTPTELHGGYKHNVVPGQARASFDCRLLPDTEVASVLGDVAKTCSRYGVEVEEVARHPGTVSRRGPLYEILERASTGLAEAPIAVPSLTSGMTDLRYLRSKGAAAYGWVPLVLGPDELSTIHGHDERIDVAAFLRAVEAMGRVVVEAST